jgi:hypothetical protein
MLQRRHHLSGRWEENGDPQHGQITGIASHSVVSSDTPVPIRLYQRPTMPIGTHGTAPLEYPNMVEFMPQSIDAISRLLLLNLPYTGA